MIESRDPAHLGSTVRPDSLSPATPSASIGALQASVSKAMGVMSLPDSVMLAGFVLSMNGGSTAPHILLRYLSRDTLTMQSSEIVRRQLANALQLPSLSISTERISPEPRSVSAAKMSALDTLSMLVRAIPSLSIVVAAGSGVPQMRIDSALARLAATGTPENRISVQRTQGRQLAARVEMQ
jgi:hypothetical protein